ncbi:4322_t:CDS:2 [Dentiscutata heterogama]|uniref:4322_t:CDS:1 n=1 Tax=Dentiscutata heterogama TaxID=1316150 RepID=A0ACA9KJK6_9GLOM|nr:4322_t:CDS:2 [Dentiscutata heterogama]
MSEKYKKQRNRYKQLRTNKTKMLTTTAIQIHININTINALSVQPMPCSYYNSQDLATK